MNCKKILLTVIIAFLAVSSGFSIKAIATTHLNSSEMSHVLKVGETKVFSAVEVKKASSSDPVDVSSKPKASKPVTNLWMQAVQWVLIIVGVLIVLFVIIGKIVSLKQKNTEEIPHQPISNDSETISEAVSSYVLHKLRK